jgi:hypothetical protein
MGNPRARYTVDGGPVPEVSDQPTADMQIVSVGYFETLQIGLRQGRLLNESDRADAPSVVVVSEAFVQREFPGEDPLGRRITLRRAVGDRADIEIVGVVENILQDRIALAGRAGEQMYFPVEQMALRAPSFAMRTAGDVTAIAADVRRAVWSVEADQPVARLRPLQAHIDESLAGPRAISLFLMVMGGIALTLAAMGVYGVMAHSVLQQRREIGIRMALGAGRGRVVRGVTRSGLGLIGAGIVLGLPFAYIMFRGTVTSLNLFNAEIGFGLPFALAGTLVVVAVLATVLPARRASTIAPVAALKE